MSRIMVFLLSVGLLVAGGVAGAESTPGEKVTKDPKGRVLSRTTTIGDEGGHRTQFEYVLDSDRASFVVDEDFDRTGRVTKRVEQRFDAQGRVTERVELQVGEAGKRTGTRTRYAYDSSGSRTETSTPVH